MNESEQAQTIEAIREMQKQRDRWRVKKTVPVKQIDMLLEIVDSKAQKIAEQAKEIERLRI